jgi:hypothetical protein
MPQDDVTEVEARAIVDAHEAKHGHDMSDKIPHGSKWGTHDVPSQSELDAEPEWHKHGKKLEDLPDD